MISDFDSHLYIKDMPSGMSPICLYREAIHLQCFTPTHYVKNGEYLSCTRILCWCFDPICSKQHCREYARIVWLYYAHLWCLWLHLSLIFMHVATLDGLIGLWMLSRKFFCLVCWLPCYTLSSYICTKSKKKNVNYCDSREHLRS